MTEAAPRPPRATSSQGTERPPSRWARARTWFASRYLTIDARTAGAFRIVLGFLLSANVLRHWAVARTYYSNDGILTNHWALFRPSSAYNFSLLHAFSSIEEVHVAFALSLFCYLALLVGYHARLFAALSLLWVSSMDSRLLLVENGGYVVVNLLALYAIFLPIDRRFSVDAWRRSLRNVRETSVAHLEQRAFRKAHAAPFTSLAAFLVILNLATIYFLNTVNKSGSVWRHGDTVHYVLHLDRMITGLAVVAREWLPYPVLQASGWAVLSIESALVWLILWPNARRITRPLAMLGMAAIHAAFGTMMRLGPFSWFMIGWSTLLPTHEHWDAVARFGKRRHVPLEVEIDETSPLAMAIARVLARLDAYDGLRFVVGPAGGPLFTVRRMLGAEAGEGEVPSTEPVAPPQVASAIARALPYGFVWFRPLSLVTFGLLGRVPGWTENHRDGLTRWLFGETPAPTPADTAPVASVEGPAPIVRRLGTVVVGLRETLLVWLLVCFALQAVMENKHIPDRFKPTQPEWMKATTHRFRTLQGWGMFSPNPIQEDGVLSIEAFTVDGRRFDPLTGKPPVLDLTDARGLGLGQIEQDYGNRIRSDRNEVFRKGLDEHLERFHLLTGNPNDMIVAFDAYWVSDKCPPPRSQTPTEPKKVAIRTWRRPGFVPPPGFPTIPPPPKLESAGK